MLPFYLVINSVPGQCFGGDPLRCSTSCLGGGQPALSTGDAACCQWGARPETRECHGRGLGGAMPANTGHSSCEPVLPLLVGHK